MDLQSGDQSLRPRMAGRFVTLCKPLPFTLTVNNCVSPSRSEANKICFPSGDQVGSQPGVCGMLPGLSPLPSMIHIWFCCVFGAPRVNVISFPLGETSGAVN